jgi:hypothetical protein
MHCSFPFKGKVGMGMVVRPSTKHLDQEQHHPHPTLPLKGRAINADNADLND